MKTRRYEFTKTTKREMLERSGGICEAIGPRYGLPPGQRCTTPIFSPGGVQFDHYPRGAHDPHPDTRKKENGVACCPYHNQWAANHIDKQVEQKIKDVRRKHGLDPDTRKPRKKIPSRGFGKKHRPLKSRSSFQTRKPNGP